MAELGTLTVCDACGDAIVWLLTTNQKRMPVDAKPDRDRGNIVRQGVTAGVLGKTKAAAARKLGGVQLFTHHALNCPYSDRWQRKGQR